MFLFKKLVGPLVLPLAVSLLLLVIGLAALWLSRRRRTARLLLTAGVVVLAVFSFAPVPEWSLGRLERTYPPFDLVHAGPAVEWVVVLSGGSSPDPALPATDRLSRATLARLVEGLRILRARPGARLLLTGGAVPGRPSEAQIMREAALSLGVDADRVVLEEASRDTQDQASNVGGFVQGAPFVLVTSASHMPRAVALFRRQGLAPIPAPTDYLVKRGSLYDADVLALYPRVDHLHQGTVWVYETLGLLWARMKGEA